MCSVKRLTLATNRAITTSTAKRGLLATRVSKRFTGTIVQCFRCTVGQEAGLYLTTRKEKQASYRSFVSQIHCGHTGDPGGPAFEHATVLPAASVPVRCCTQSMLLDYRTNHSCPLTSWSTISPIFCCATLFSPRGRLSNHGALTRYAVYMWKSGNFSNFRRVRSTRSPVRYMTASARRAAHRLE